MLRSLVQSSLKSPLVVIALAAALVVLGSARLRDMPVDVLPEFSVPYVEIQTESLGLSAEEVEQLITVPMEQDLLNGLPWLQTIRSESVPGLSSIVLVFEPGTNLMRARQMVSERLTQAVALPHVSRPPVMLQPMSATSRVMIVGLSSQSLSPIQMSVLARWTIVPRLMGVPGVANVVIWGQRDRQLQVQVDPKRLQAHGTSLLKVLETTGNALWVSSLTFVEASTPGTSGFIDTNNQRIGIRHILPIVSPAGLSQVPIDGSSLRLGDVADVVEDHQPLIGDALTKSGPGLLLVVEKFPGANSLNVTRGVEEALSELGPGLSGMDMDSNVFRPADFIETATRNVRLAAILGFLLVALALCALFFEWRAAFVSLVSIPLSLLAAGLVLHLTGATLNTIVLAGLAIALIAVVHDSVASVENVTRRLRERRAQGIATPVSKEVLDATLEVRTPLLYTTLILFLSVAPILFVRGVAGAFFHPLVLSYGLAVVASMIVALTVTPALCLILLRRAPRRESPLVAWLERLHESALAPIIRRGGLAFGAIVVLAMAGLAVVPFLNPSLVPSFKERSLLIHLTCVPGTSQPEMSRVAGLVCRDLRSIPGVRDVGAHIGRALQGDQVVNVNASQVWVTIDPRANYGKTTAAIQRVVDAYPGVRHKVQTYLKAASEDVVPRSEDDVIVRVYGDVEGSLRSQAENVRKTVAGVRGVEKTYLRLPMQQVTLETEVDLAAARRHGLKPGDVRRGAATLLSGIQVGSLFEAQKVFDVVVWSTPATRHSLHDIGDLLIDTPSGGHVRLGDVATVRMVSAPSVIRHDAVKRYLDVVAEVKGRGLKSVATDITNRVRQVQFPLEYHARVLGESAEAHDTRRRLLVSALLAMIGVLLLLHEGFENWRLAALSFLTLPAAITGGLLAVVVTGGVLSSGAIAGLLAVSQIAVSSIMSLITRYQSLERNEGEILGIGLALRGARERVAPMVMTMLATGMALLPAVMLGDVPGLEVVRPMAIVVLGGLLTTALVGMVLVPMLFLSLGVSSVREPERIAFQNSSFGAAPHPRGAACD